MKKILTLIVSVTVTIMMCVPVVATASSGSSKVSIIFTSDMHSHLDSVKVLRNGKATQYGGFARVRTAAKDIEKDYPDSLMVDAGNFSMGTAYQTIFKSSASELRTMGSMGYDAVALGKNEFDFGADGLAKMIKKASSDVGTSTSTTTAYNTQTYQYDTTTTTTKNMPDLVCGNINWNKSLSSASLKNNAKKLKNAMDKYGAEDYTVIDKNGTKIAVIGLMGKTAVKEMSDGGVKWSSYTDRAQSIVNEIERNGEADMIVCLLNGGLKDSSGDAVDLAKKVDGLDVIVSGNQNSGVKDPVSEGDTTIVACDPYTDTMGHLVLQKSGSKYTVSKYDLIKLDSSVKQNSSIESKAQSFAYDINSNYFSNYGFKYNQTVARSSYNFASLSDIQNSSADQPLCNMITDSYLYSIKHAQGSAKGRASVAIMDSATLSGSIVKGAITTADIFDVCSYGIGPDKKSGYPLTSFWLTGKEIKNLAEAAVSLSGPDKDLKIYTSGLKYGFNKHRIYLNKAVDVKIDAGGGNYITPQNSKRYKVVADYYTAKELSKINSDSHGLLSVEPKDKSGKTIKNFDNCVVKRNGHECKQWYSLAKYMEVNNGGILSNRYKQAQTSVSDETSWNPISMFKQPNNLALIIFAAILIPVVIVIGIIVYFVKRRQKKRGFGKTMFSGKTGRKERGGMKLHTKRYKSKFK